ncbi:MAG: arylesterase [Betaproteobacteria bacterium]|nr:arylesterase [Betaproteobacteria bacterium]
MKCYSDPILRLALILSLALVAGCGGSAPRLAPLAPDAVVLAFGDSITFGTGAGANQSYPAVLASLIGRKVESAGVPGETSEGGLARLPQALDYYQPQLVIICEGGNDFLRKLNEKQTAANIRAMVRAARGKGAAVLLVAVPKPGLLPSPPDFYEEIAGDFAIPLEAAALKKILRDNELKSDLVHPNAKGYASLAQALAEVLKKSGAI